MLVEEDVKESLFFYNINSDIVQYDMISIVQETLNKCLNFVREKYSFN